MTTVVVARLGGTVAIAADTLITFGDTRLAHGYEASEVFEFDRFWGIGTGRAFALGAMCAGYDKARSARDVAELGVRAGCEFDKNSSAPIHTHTIKLKATAKG